MSRLGIARQIREIRTDPALRWFGCAVALTNALSMLHWRSRDAVGFLASGTDAICWPLLPHCEFLRVLSAGEVAWTFRAFFAASLLVAGLFAVRKTVGFAYAGLAALTLVKLLILALDFRLRANQHYMALWVTLAFLFLPRKRDAIRVLLVLFYVWASSIKFNADWLSGAALAGPLWFVPANLTAAACVYVVFLELVVSWGLLAARGWVFWGAFAQFLLFHAMSWSQVGFFYPLLMFLLLLIFPLARLIAPPEAPPQREESLLARLFRLRLNPATYGLIALFSFCQLIPVLIPGDEKTTGEGRLYALHMVDARIVCRGWAVLHRRDGSVYEVELNRGLLTRIACDPIVVAERGRNFCRHAREAGSEVAEVDLHLVSRRYGETASRQVIDLPGFCAHPVRYNPFWHNRWILPGG